MRRHRLLLIALLLLAFTAHARPVAAAWPNDPNTNVPLCTAPGNQYVTTSTSDGAGGAIVIWYDLRTGTNYDVYAQRISAAGTPLWGADGVALCSAAGDQYYPAIVSDGAGGAIVTWYDFRSGNADIYAQRISAAGTPLWTADGVALSTAAGDQFTPAIASDGAGGAIVTWTDTRSGTGYDIYAQRISAAGTPLWTLNGVTVCSAASDQSNPTITIDGAGGAFITWIDNRNGNTDIFAQRISAAGALLWIPPNGISLCSAAGAQQAPAITSDGAGGAIVTWHDQRSGTNFDIYAQRVNSAGSQPWTANGVALCSAAGNQNSPTIISDGAGGAIVTWYDLRSGSYDIYSQRISAAGTPLWTANGVALCTASGTQQLPVIASDGAGGALVTWADSRSATNYDVYGQRISAAGTPLWTANGVVISSAASDQAPTTITSDGAGGAIVFWQDGRGGSGNSDVYAQRVDPFGYLSAEPVIANVRDIPFDQGGSVKVSWQGSPIDAVFDPNLSYYDILRSVPTSIAMDRIRRGGAVSASFDRVKSDGDLVSLPMRGQTYYWERLTSIAALHYISTYGYIAATLQDSVSEDNPKTAFLVVARNATGTMFWLSQPDSGYSVDNLAPAAPAPFTGQYAAGSTKLHWNRNSEADLAGYRLYRGTNGSFTPSAANLVSALPDTGYTDAAAAPYIYKLTAVDSHGNESRVATLTPTGTLGVGDGAALALAFAAPSPNPARGSTTLEFTLPQTGHVRLSVFDAAGRRVQMLRDGEMAAGAHREAFALRDDAGRDLAAGLYLVRLETAGRVITRRLAAVR